MTRDEKEGACVWYAGGALFGVITVSNDLSWWLLVVPFYAYCLLWIIITFCDAFRRNEEKTV